MLARDYALSSRYVSIVSVLANDRKFRGSYFRGGQSIHENHDLHLVKISHLILKIVAHFKSLFNREDNFQLILVVQRLDNYLHL